MKWFSQYLVAPLLAAVFVTAGNYWFVIRPALQQEYTKIGLDILLQKDAPAHLRSYAEELLSENSPVILSTSGS